jgi:hypothetical protein
METRFGHSFPRVRVHSDVSAAQYANSLSAKAFTVGNHIFFDKNEYAPSSRQGRELLAHELTHVLQQHPSQRISRAPRRRRRRRGIITRRVRRRIRQTISNAPPRYSQWNASFPWIARFDLIIDQSLKNVTVVSRLYSPASRRIRRMWERAIENRWSDRHDLVVHDRNGQETDRYRIYIDLRWLRRPRGAHYRIAPGRPGGTAGGRAGRGGTTSMTTWGTRDVVDITHEFGHILGNVDEYFTTNGIDYTRGGRRAGFRDPGGGIMNNPSEDPFRRHYELIRREFARALRIRAGRVTIENKLPVGDFYLPGEWPPTDYPLPQTEPRSAYA